VIDAKLLNRLLWAVNLLLGAGILVFSFQYLLRASDSKIDIRPDDDNVKVTKAPTDQGNGALTTLPNPIVKREDSKLPTDVPFKAVLKGTLPSEKEPKRGVAFIKSQARNVELVAYVDEEITQEGKPYEEYRGWMLVSVNKDRAVFANRKGEKVELSIDLSFAAAPGGNPAVGPSGTGLPRASQIGKAYTSDQYKSRLLASAESRQVWGLDQDEIEWANQNSEQIVDRDFQVAPYAGGGLRIEGVTAGSIGAARGLLAGDVVRDVNGQPLNSIGDIRTLMNNPSMKSQNGLRLTLERAGKPMVIEYRPLPR
jgi:hypothetical protein